MYSSNLASENQETTRLTVADILSTMASNGDMTPTTLSLLDGLTGVPTRTTPTLTPTTLRNIEQTFLDLAANQVSHEHEAGFVPPSVPPSTIPHTSTTSVSSTSVANYTATVTTTSQQNSINPNSEMKQWTGSHNSSGIVTVAGVSRTTIRRLSVGSSSSSSNSSFGSASVTYTSNRKGGGRRKEDRDKEDLSGEEAEKRKIRRERNKLAAARCRKRRLDHTMSLQQETDMLEEKKQSMQNEIRQLQKQKEELELLLESHRLQCKMRKTSHGSGKSANLLSVPNLNLLMKNRVTIKEERQDTDDSCSSEDTELDNFDRVHLSQSIHPKVEFTKPAPRPRPTSLPVASPFTQQIPRSSSNMNEIAGIAITTPSSGIPGFNFESLMEGGTGLTPVVPSPSCSTQQRSSNLPVDLSSPEAVNRKLVSL